MEMNATYRADEAVKQDWWWSRRVWLRVDDAMWDAVRAASDLDVSIATIMAQEELDDGLESRVCLEMEWRL